MKKISPLFSVFCIIVLFALPIFGQESHTKRFITVDDFFQIKQVDDPQISPEGDYVAYTVFQYNLDADKSEKQIWMTSTIDNMAIQITAKGTSASQPRWSPDGKYLSFLSEGNDKKMQVWVMNRRGGAPSQLTNVKQGVESYEWSPDSKRLVLLIKDLETQIDPKPWVIDRLQIKRDYVGYLDSRRTHLYLFTLVDSSVTQLTFGDYDDSEPSWSPDGKQIAFVSNRTENPDANVNTDIWIISLDHRDNSPIQLTTNPGPDNSPSWSMNKEWITYVTVTEPELVWYAINQLAVVSSKGGKPSLLTHDLDRNIRFPRFAPDSKSIYFIVEDSGEQQLVSINLADNIIRRRTAGPRSIRGFSFNKSGAKAILNSESNLPAEVFLLKNDKLVPLTKTNENILRNLQLAEVENIHFNSSDGTALEGFIYKPPNFSAQERYPTLLQIHGGPVAQYDFHFNFDAQLFAAHGYLVLMVNPRGSSGYGQDFALAIWQDWGNKDYSDVMAGVDYVIQRGYADPERLGVGGWSYGGILTNYVITKTDRFKGAITGASEVLYIANYGHDHYQNLWEQEIGLPWENRELWERLSPFNYVQNIVTPTLIMGGEKDWNCPILNSEQLYQALKRLGRITQLVIYPDEHHGEGDIPFSNLNRASFQRDRFERYLDWYDKYVK